MVQVFTKDNIFEMDAMHDCYISDISLKEKTLIITYDNLSEGLVDVNGDPIYKNKKLIIRYEFNSCCDVTWRNKRKWDAIDFYKNPDDFYKKFKNYVFLSYKYSVDCFNELSLALTAYKLKNGEETGANIWVDIHTDIKTVTYTWE
jgi:hypothetical protein